MIKPTIGRVVWFFHSNRDYHGSAANQANGDAPQPNSASIAFVHNERLITIGGFDHRGVPFNRENVRLVQEGDDVPEGEFCAWMPYQQGQARAQVAGTGDAGPAPG